MGKYDRDKTIRLLVSWKLASRRRLPEGNFSGEAASISLLPPVSGSSAAGSDVDGDASWISGVFWKPEDLIGLSSSCSVLSHLIKSPVHINSISIYRSQYVNTTGLHVRKKGQFWMSRYKMSKHFSPLTFTMVFDVVSSYNHFTPQIMSRHGAHFHLEIRCKLPKRGVLQKHMHIDFSLISAALLGDALKSHQGERRGRKNDNMLRI